MECGALSSMKDELKLDFGFTIWADLLTCREENIFSLKNSHLLEIVLLMPVNLH